MRTVCLMLTLACLVLSAGVCHAAIYKWVDENGTITFRDTPPPEGTEAKVLDPKPLPRVGYESDRKKAKPESDAKKKVTKTKDFPAVKLYVTSWCGYCDKAKTFLRQNGVPFKVLDVERNAQAARRFKEINPRGGVPVAEIGGRVVHGFAPGVYSQALGL